MESQITPRAADRPDPSLERLRTADVLVIDDEPGIRNFLVKTLSPHCRSVSEAADAREASDMLDRRRFDVVLLDNNLPGVSGIDWLTKQRGHGWRFEAIMMTGFADLDTAIDAMRAGASDFLLKPCRANQVLNAVRRGIEVSALRRENLLLRHEIDRANIRLSCRNQLLGKSAAIEEVRERLRRVAPLPTPVMICGGTGSGKEAAARSLHAFSNRGDRPFVPISCAAVLESTLEVELLGGGVADRERGRDGLLASAEGGTLFFSEISELSKPSQTALLRILDNPAAGSAALGRDIRFVFSTRRDLAAEVQAGRFRDDLFFRVNVLQIRMPDLRMRDLDVIDLAEFLISGLAVDLGLEPLKIDSTVRSALLRYGWPGNIRELQNFVERSLIFGRFDLDGLRPGQAEPIESLDAVERRHILQAIDRAGGNRSRAAEWLGISRKTIERKCALWGI